MYSRIGFILKTPSFRMAHESVDKLMKGREAILAQSSPGEMTVIHTRTSRLSCEFVSNVPRLLVPTVVHTLPPLPLVATDNWFSS